jgi:hypothetical protein
MPIVWRISGYRIEIAFSDPYTQDEAERVMKEIYARPDVTLPLRLLVDVRQSTPPTTEFVGNAIMFWQLHVDKMWSAKIAVVTGTSGQTRMAEVSGRTAESRDLPFTMRTFDGTEIAEALAWLRAE